VNAGVQDLGTLETGGRSEATAVNDLGHVAGTASVGNVTHAFVWTEATGMRDITPGLPGGVTSVTGINRSARWWAISRTIAPTGSLVA
jgi:probable HAF family extracellular repeat protein